jgi:hypothetical protein
MPLAPYMCPPRCSTGLRDEAVLGCLVHRPSTARDMARFLRQPIGALLERLQYLVARGEVTRTEKGLYCLVKKEGNNDTSSR